MRDRSNIVDLVLAFAATFVVTLAVWPRDTPRQIIRCKLADQSWKTYSIAIDDPSLDELKRKVRRWTTPELHPEYVTAKWQKEVAEFYENCKPSRADQDSVPRPITRPITRQTRRPLSTHRPLTATISDTVTTASYETETGESSGTIRMAAYAEPTESYAEPAEPFVEPAATSVAEEAQYWSTVKASAVASMQAVETRSANVPVVFEQVTRPSWPQLAFHFAFLFGIAAACGYMHWLKRAPLRNGDSFAQQPIGVLARIGTFSGAIVVALISAVAVWV